MVWRIAMLHGTVELILLLLQLNPKCLLFCTAFFFFLTEVELIFWIYADFSKLWVSKSFQNLVLFPAYEDGNKYCSIHSAPCSVRNIFVLGDFIGSGTVIRAFCLVWGFTSVLVASSSFYDLICILKSHVVQLCLLKCQQGFGVGWGCSSVCPFPQLRLCRQQSPRLHRSGHFREILEVHRHRTRACIARANVLM